MHVCELDISQKWSVWLQQSGTSTDNDSTSRRYSWGYGKELMYDMKVARASCEQNTNGNNSNSNRL